MTKGKKRWFCAHCGKRFRWGSESRYFYGPPDEDGSIIVVCSEQCEKAYLGVEDDD